MASPVGTSATLLKTIGATKFTSQKSDLNASSKLLKNFPRFIRSQKLLSQCCRRRRSRSRQRSRQPHVSPLCPISDAQLRAIQQLARIFNHASQQTTSVPLSTLVARPEPVSSAPPRVPVHTSPSPRVPVSVPSLRVPLSPTTLRIPLRRPPPNLIEPNHDDPAASRYPLHSQHALATTVPQVYAGIKPRYFGALHILLSQEQAYVVINEVTGQSLDLRQLLQGPNKSTWRTSLVNNLGRLTQGVGTRMPRGTNTVFYVPKFRVPVDCKVTYARGSSPIKIKFQKIQTFRTSEILSFKNTSNRQTSLNPNVDKSLEP